jgi:hypothetical protein
VGAVGFRANARTLLSLERGMLNLERLANQTQWQCYLASESQTHLRTLKLPSGWLDQVARQEQSFDVIPSEINYCPTKDLKWNPMPTLQAYVTYAPWLDKLNARHYLDQH